MNISAIFFLKHCALKSLQLIRTVYNNMASENVTITIYSTSPPEQSNKVTSKRKKLQLNGTKKTVTIGFKSNDTATGTTVAREPTRSEETRPKRTRKVPERFEPNEHVVDDFSDGGSAYSSD